MANVVFCFLASALAGGTSSSSSESWSPYLEKWATCTREDEVQSADQSSQAQV